MDTLDVLVKTLADEKQPISIAKLYSLSGLEPDGLARVRNVWPSIPGDRRHIIMRHLVDISESNFEVDFSAVFRLGLSDAEPDVRVDAIDGLWEEDDVKLIAPLLGLMQNDESEAVRAAAAGSLGRFVLAGELEEIPADRAEQVVNALRDEIENADETLDVRRRALEAISYSGAEGISDMISEAYGDEDELMRVSAVFAMGRSADLRWADLVLHETDSPEPEMRFEAARACGELQNPGAVPALSHLLDDPDDQVREAAVWALGQIGGRESRRLLTTILEDEESDLHEAAEAALEELEFLNDDGRDFSLLEFFDDNGASDRDD